MAWEPPENDYNSKKIVSGFTSQLPAEFKTYIVPSDWWQSQPGGAFLTTPPLPPDVPVP
jgi:hypothetical protein